MESEGIYQLFLCRLEYGMKRYRKFYIILSLMLTTIMMVSCSKKAEESQEDEKISSVFSLYTSTGEQLDFQAPEPFMKAEEKETSGTLTLTDSGSSIDTLTLLLIPVSKEYGEKKVRQDTEEFVREYENLTQENNGTVEEKSSLIKMKFGDYVVTYSDICYELDHTMSYCVKFYTLITAKDKKDSYILTGNIRTGEDTADKFEIETLLDELFSSMKWHA